MPSYLNSNGNSVGSLLRFIQEQKSQSPIIPQGSEVGSPLRDVVQEPLKGSEGQGTSKVVSLRPEGTLTEGGETIRQGTPQSSRVGPISIGGSDIGPVAPPSVVAANEPGTGFSIPSATRTAGDVVNKTGAASGEPKVSTPSLGTTIKASTPTTKSGLATEVTRPGQQVGNYSLLNEARAGEKTAQQMREAISANERSTADTEAEIARKQAEIDAGPSIEDLDKQIFAPGLKSQATKGSPEYIALLADARKKSQEYIAKQNANPNFLLEEYGLPTPTPTPMPMQGGQVQGASSGGSSGGGGGTTSGVMRSVAPKVNYATQQSKNQYSTPVPKQSTKASTPIKSTSAPKAPSIGTILGGGALQAIKKLFGR